MRYSPLPQNLLTPNKLMTHTAQSFNLSSHLNLPECCVIPLLPHLFSSRSLRHLLMLYSLFPKLPFFTPNTLMTPQNPFFQPSLSPELT